MHHVILGAGPAGVTAAETLRQIDPDARITVISGEPEPPYSRMAIPYLLHGDIEEPGTHLRQSAGHYDTHAIKIEHGRAGGIDTKTRKLFLAGSGEIAYDKLLIASGASPIIPPIDGANLPGVHACWTLADAREILKLAEEGSPVVLVGAGFIGSIVLEALHGRGADLTVVEVAPRMVARMMDETAGGMLKRWAEAKGVKVATGTRVERISQTGGVGTAGLGVHLSNGNSIAARLVVMAAGVRPNTGFLVRSDIRIDRGISIDEHMQTSAGDVYAAGDCAEGIDLSTGKPDILAIQPTAVEHGRIAALNMGGVPTRHRGSLNMNVLDTIGLITASFGLWQGVSPGYGSKAVDEQGYKYIRLEFDGDRLIGGQTVGLTEHVGMMRGLIQSGTRLGGWRDKLMASPERVNEAYVAMMQGLPGAGPSGPRLKIPVA